MATTVVPARFTRGPFAHERKFHVPAPDGGEYTGLAYVDYCLTPGYRKTKPAELPPGRSVVGFLVVRVLAELPTGRLLLNVPDGENCEVAAGLVVLAEPGPLLRLLDGGRLSIHPKVRRRVARPSPTHTCLSPGFANPLHGYKSGPVAFGPILFAEPRK